MHNFFELPLNVVFIVGSCRSGKTSIGRLISTSRNTEFIDEPPLLVSLPILSKTKRVEKKEAISMFQSYLIELVFDIVLMRGSNFRPYDDSSVWKTTNLEEILIRISLKRSKDAYNYISDHGFTIVISLPNNIENIDFISEAYPGSKIIKVVRDGMNVAGLTREKGWFSNSSLISGFEESITSKFIDKNDIAWNLPWWVDDGNIFLGFSEYERGLYYWCQTNKFTKFSDKLPNVFSISFENFIKKTFEIKHDIFNFLEIKESNMTSMVELEISKYKDISSVDYGNYICNIENLLKIKYKDIMKENYG
jgi:hypothetical protein